MSHNYKLLQTHAQQTQEEVKSKKKKKWLILNAIRRAINRHNKN